MQLVERSVPEEQTVLRTEASGPRVHHPDVDRAECGPWQEGRRGGRTAKRYNPWRLCTLPDGTRFIQMRLGGLDGGHTSLFDPDQLERAQMHVWTVVRKTADLHYARTCAGKARTPLTLHHHLWPSFPPGRPIDHLNRNGTDNRRANLRDGGDSVNQNNRGVKRTNRGYLTGVSRDASGWRAEIGTRGTAGYRRKRFADAKYGGRAKAYEAASAQRALWAAAAENRNGLPPR